MKRLVLIGACALSGCGALGGGRPVIENRYDRVTAQSNVDRPLIQLAVSTSPVVSAPGGVAITALGDRAQAALVAETKGKPPLVLRAAGDDPGALERLDRFERHFEVSSRLVEFPAPGDRIDAISIQLQVAPAQAASWKIVSWTQASNGKQVIEIGRLTDANTNSVSGSAGLNLGGLLPSATIGAESSRSVTRETILTDVTEFDAAVDERGVAWLDETAGWRVNLAHNLSMDAVIGATEKAGHVAHHRLAFTDLGDAKGGPAKPKDVRLIDITSYEPAAADAPVCGVARIKYRLRHIARGAATFTEADDRIEYRIGYSKAAFLLSPAPYRALYKLTSGGNDLSWQVPAGTPQGVLFASLEEATAFRDWMLEAPGFAGRLGNGTIGVVGAAGKVAPPSRRTVATLVPGLANPQRALRAARADATACTDAAEGVAAWE